MVSGESGPNASKCKSRVLGTFLLVAISVLDFLTLSVLSKEELAERPPARERWGCGVKSCGVAAGPSCGWVRAVSTVSRDAIFAAVWNAGTRASPSCARVYTSVRFNSGACDVG
ncbi:hypothetical protein BABINDRAFT_151709 [Babjeviella inositovora NRRL Y-12698]|uniref:Uncharacterized protein n=1 Tax=Babjeviella inositovora NRRL Y-12698 TaxID=984486 RepID=A0A1E3QLU1_9ASCO|nr:uncharacterized protein BABINDRAFT_151709 [Babjeviella inositovora NRRL Y-12698]ODQ78655.1 hypothetical protein BABINDRAFT_151709 [Babjeviella inositovora NRRL Y-12698]